MSKAYCYISTSGGLDYLAFALNRPMIISSPTIHDLFIEKNNIIYMIKRYFDLKRKKYLKLNEIFNKFAFQDKNDFFKKNNILIKENTKHQWNKIILDFNMLNKNNFNLSKKNKKISDKFWNLFLKNIYKTSSKNYYKKNKIKSFYSWSNFD